MASNGHGVERDFESGKAGDFCCGRHVVHVLQGASGKDPDHRHPGNASKEVCHWRGVAVWFWMPMLLDEPTAGVDPELR